MRTLWFGPLVAVALFTSTTYAQTADDAVPPNCADNDAYCADATPALLLADAGTGVEVAGVQTTASDARETGEDEPFIINDGFGD
jgi:hypothetical protein